MKDGVRVIRRVALAVLALAAAGVLVSCGGEKPAADKVADPGTATEAPSAGTSTPTAADPGVPAEDSIEIKNWFNPMGVGLLTTQLRELEWTWTGTEDGVEQETMRVAYRLAGKETVAGKDATRLELSVDGEPWILWMAEDGSVVQAEIGGEKLPTEMASLVVAPMVTGLFWPFLMADAYEVDKVVTGTHENWSVTVADAGRQQFGPTSARVQRVTTTVSGPPYTDAGETMTMVWSIGDFGAFQMLVEWRVQGEGEAGEESFHMQVLRVETL